MPEVMIALGANIGDPIAQLQRAVESLGQVVEVQQISSLYRTAPEGVHDQPDFHNLVLTARSTLEPLRLLQEAMRIEAEIGRVRSYRNAPRPIDIDLIDVGGTILTSPTLTLPHPRMHLRAFVLVPLVEVAPDWRHPVLQRTAAELLALLPDNGGVERLGPLFPTA